MLVKLLLRIVPGRIEAKLSGSEPRNLEAPVS
jgi:hypothetical protein